MWNCSTISLLGITKRHDIGLVLNQVRATLPAFTESSGSSKNEEKNTHLWLCTAQQAKSIELSCQRLKSVQGIDLRKTEDVLGLLGDFFLLGFCDWCWMCSSLKRDQGLNSLH